VAFVVVLGLVITAVALSILLFQLAT
jgi:hypothetical protein